MTGDRRQPLDIDPLDDEALGALVRDVAAGWTMPPIRLDAPAWRDRVRTRPGSRFLPARGAVGRLGQALMAAATLTVAAALVAVVLTRPPTAPGTSPGATSGSTARPSAAVAATPLPKLLLNGDLPVPSRAIVWADGIAFLPVDLASGMLGPALPDAEYGSAFRQLADGSAWCLCLKESGSVAGQPTSATVRLARFDPLGHELSSTPIETFTGAEDPRDAGASIPEEPRHVLTALSFSDDGRYGFVGWSRRVPPAWQSGLLVVDLANGSVIGRAALPDEGTGEGDARRVVEAPTVIGATAAGDVLISRYRYGWSPASSYSPTYDFGSDVYTAGLEAGLLGAPTQLDIAGTCGETVTRGGPTADGGLWLACANLGSSQTIVRRLAADGTGLGDTAVPGVTDVAGDMTALSPDREALFVWNPVSARVTRVDLTTGEVTTGQAPAQAAHGPGPLAALGAWLAPAAAAKTYLQGAIVVSPDSSRIYALGVTGASTTGPEPGGSSGVLVFDAHTLASLGRWAATADFVSLSVSPDGRFVYAAGMPGFDASGNEGSQPASITVFDAADGSVRLLNGQLGHAMLLFPGPAID